MKKKILTMVAAAAMTLAMSVTAFAAGWMQNDTGWWYGTNADNTTWCSNGWQWIDGNGDGVAECYYFDGNGYMAANTTTPDGYTVNADGAWTVNGVVQTQTVNAGQNTVESGYNADGFSNEAIAMLGRIKAENDALYGKTYDDVVDGYGGTNYDNGFGVNYYQNMPTEVTCKTPSQLIEGANDNIYGKENILSHVKSLGYTDAYENGGIVYLRNPNYFVTWWTVNGKNVVKIDFYG